MHPFKLRLLILALLAFAGFWGFVEIADEVLEGNTHRFDSEVLMALRLPQDPNTPIGRTEYNWGAENHISGATAQADVLGILGREGVDIANRWVTPASSTPNRSPATN